MIESILFKQVILLSHSGLKRGDLLIENGLIKAIEPSLPEHAELIIRDKGLALMPGVIDPHVHFRDPGLTHKEDLESGSRAAASGGVTSYFDMPNTLPTTCTLEALASKKAKAAEKSLVNYNFFMGASPSNLDELMKAENIPGIKIYVGSSTGNLLVDQEDVLDLIFAKTPHLIAVHSESERLIQEGKERYIESRNPEDHMRIRSAEAALESTKRVLHLAKKYQHRTHICHISTADELDLLRAEKLFPLISCEVTPQHFLLHGPEIYQKLGTLAQMNPPIREKRHAEALWQGLLDGCISNIATDHAPHTLDEKALPFGKAPSGLPGIETSLPLMLNRFNQELCTLPQLVQWMCKAPASLFSIANKGELKVGYDADLVLVDLNASKTIKRENVISKCGWSAFEGWTLKGWPVMTLVNGQPVFREGDFFESIKGKEIRINPSSSD